eukprot:6182454-Pleurochrysis_carterae.AAC.1
MPVVWRVDEEKTTRGRMVDTRADAAGAAALSSKSGAGDTLLLPRPTILQFLLLAGLHGDAPDMSPTVYCAGLLHPGPLGSGSAPQKRQIT